MRLPLRVKWSVIFPLILGNLVFATAYGQDVTSCLAAQRQLEASVKDQPNRASELLASAVRDNPGCASALVGSAIIAAEASDEMVAQLVSAAVKASPGQAVAIAESAIVASPSSSDKVASVVQTVLGDCDSIAEDVGISIRKNRERLLVILEDALKSHGNCACEIVKVAVQAAGGSSSIVSQVVQTAVTVEPTRAAEISECAVAAAPSLATAIQGGLDRALSDSGRGPGSMAAELADDSSPYREESAVVSASPSTTTQYASSYGKGNGERGYGKSGYGKGGGHGVESGNEGSDPREPWSWADWGGFGGRAGSPGGVYLIAPAGGIVPPGEVAVPISPTDPKKEG